MRKETNSATVDSMKKYLLASFTSFLFDRSTSRDWERRFRNSLTMPMQVSHSWLSRDFITVWPWREQSGGKCCEAWWRRPRCRRPESAGRVRSPRSTAQTSPSAAGLGLDPLLHTEKEAKSDFKSKTFRRCKLGRTWRDQRHLVILHHQSSEWVLGGRFQAWYKHSCDV